jgi:hypothetical protein
LSQILRDHFLSGKSFLLRIAFVLLGTCSVRAHDIPADVTVKAFLKPEGHHLHLLVRVPLGAIRDVDFPSWGPGYLDVEKLAPLLPDATTVWIARLIDLYEGEARLAEPRILATQISLPSDRSFSSYDAAAAHVFGPKLRNDAGLVWNQVLVDVLFEYNIDSDQSQFSIDPHLDRLAARTTTALSFLPANGAIRAYEFTGRPGLIHLDPSWRQAAFRFVALGFFHILDGADHLLFLLCLVIPFRRFRGLIPVVTAFTVAHSITLIASAYDLAPGALWFPPLIETLIAISIVYMAIENILGGSTVTRRWMMAFGFGLIHGFGFSFGLRETLQFAGSHLLTSLLSFNVGVELGQLAVLLVFVPLLEATFRFVMAERTGTILISAFVAHSAWHWTADRFDRLRQFQFEWPAFSVAFVADLVRWLALSLLIAGAVWLFSRLVPNGSEKQVRPQGG